MTAYYNDNEPYAAQWLRNLISANLIAPGHVDERSIIDVRPSDLGGYAQCHFFAGIGGWSLALRLAGWPDDRPCWTGSCPCQPFSDAGARRGFADARHLWPAWFALVREHRPAAIFGEQVSRAIGPGWLDAVAADLEREGYAFGATVLPACAVDAPHQRDRLWFVADTDREGQRGLPVDAEMARAPEPVADAPRHAGDELRETGPTGCELSLRGCSSEPRGGCGPVQPWPPESGIRRVAHGIPARASKLRALGNAIVPQVAAQFIAAYCEARGG